MAYLLNLLYLLVLCLASPWLLYAAVRHGKYREGWASRLLGRVPVPAADRPRVWLHAVSVGEVNLLQPLLLELENADPRLECVISTTTRTGYALACRKYAPRTVFHCPLDFSWAVRTAMRRVRPELLVLVELELWPNLLAAARERGVRVAIVNGRLSDRSARGYGRLRSLVAGWLRGVDLVAVQNEPYAERFRQLGVAPSSVHVTGSIKFDGAQTERANPHTMRLAKLWSLSSEDIVFLAGSTQEPEEQLAVEAFQQLRTEFPRLRLIVVPRHPQRFDDVARMLDQHNLDWVRRSELETRPPDRRRTAVLLVDTIGELGAWWGTARLAFVGGSLGTRGGQNMIEPAAYGAAVAFGHRTSNFRDVVEMLLEREAAVVVRDGEQLRDFVRRGLQQPDWAATMGDRARNLVREQSGATGRTVRLLQPLLESTLPSTSRDPNSRDPNSRDPISRDPISGDPTSGQTRPAATRRRAG
jgi:3-deoxy-D-manno-octulosonic-acid transferase